jgi:hypothetical protein
MIAVALSYSASRQANADPIISVGSYTPSTMVHAARICNIVLRGDTLECGMWNTSYIGREHPTEGLAGHSYALGLICIPLFGHEGA